MMARFESGEVLLTTTIREIGGDIGGGVVARDVSSREFLAHLEAVESREFRGLRMAHRAAGIERAGEFDAHLTRHFLLGHMEHLREQISRDFKCDAHRDSVAAESPPTRAVFHP